jgi:hypothetical protein
MIMNNNYAFVNTFQSVVHLGSTARFPVWALLGLAVRSRNASPTATAARPKHANVPKSSLGVSPPFANLTRFECGNIN